MSTIYSPFFVSLIILFGFIVVCTLQCLDENGCKTEQIIPFHVEMIGLLNGCCETMQWIRNTTGFDKQNQVDYQSDSIVVVGDVNQSNGDSTVTTNGTSTDMDVKELSNVKRNVESLREVICEFIAALQEWLKVLNEAIESKESTAQTDQENIENID